MAKDRSRVEFEPEVEIGESANAPLAGGGVLMKLENETQMAVAYQRPRNLAKIHADSIAELETFPDYAQAALYTKPVGKNDKGEMQFHTDLSVRAAEGLLYHVGNAATASELIIVDDDTIIVMSVYLDLENNVRRAVPRRVSRKSKRRSGQTVRLTDERFDMKLMSEVSKGAREVILRSIPVSIREAFKARALALNSQIDEDQLKNLLQAYGSIDISEEQLEQFLGHPVKKCTPKKIVLLRGMYNALKDGEMQPATFFGAGVEADTPDAEFEDTPPVDLSDFGEGEKEAAGEKAPDKPAGETEEPEKKPAPKGKKVAGSKKGTTAKKAADKNEEGGETEEPDDLAFGDEPDGTEKQADL